jgi:sugar-phosphatase
MTPQTLLANAHALLVDLDGTLIDSEGAVRRAWGGFAVRHGLDADTVTKDAHGRPSRETIRALLPDLPDLDAETARFEADEVADVEGIVALPGARELLAGPGRPLAIVTSCTTALARARLRAAGLPEPDVLVTADAITHGKPDPEPFLLGARRLGVDPADCVVLEDAPAGIASGRAAGATVIALRTTHPDADLGGADALVDGLPELLAAVELCTVEQGSRHAGASQRAGAGVPSLHVRLEEERAAVPGRPAR